MAKYLVWASLIALLAGCSREAPYVVLCAIDDNANPPHTVMNVSTHVGATPAQLKSWAHQILSKEKYPKRVELNFIDDSNNLIAVWTEGELMSQQDLKKLNASTRTQTPFSSIKDVSAPARRALAAAGYESLEQLDGVSEKHLTKLHGMGPKALRALKAALKEKQMALKE